MTKNDLRKRIEHLEDQLAHVNDRLARGLQAISEAMELMSIGFETRSLVLVDKDGNQRIVMAVDDAAGATGIEIRDRHNRPAAYFAVCSENRSICLLNANGKPAAILNSDGESGSVVLKSDDAYVAHGPAVAEKP